MLAVHAPSPQLVVVLVYDDFMATVVVVILAEVMRNTREVCVSSHQRPIEYLVSVSRSLEVYYVGFYYGIGRMGAVCVYPCSLYAARLCCHTYTRMHARTHAHTHTEHMHRHVFIQDHICWQFIARPLSFVHVQNKL